MKELSITVSCPGEDESTYRFSDYPVRIGRSLECHLSICHEAVPRELCSAWLERGGKTVRVEERPNLSNPLRMGKNLVIGGASGRRLDLVVGPVAIHISPADMTPDLPEIDKKRLARVLLPAASLSAVIIAALLWSGQGDGAKKTDGLSRLPDQPICGEIEEHCDSAESCVERARLLFTRAKELLSRADQDPSKKVRAAKMFAKCSALYGALGAPEAKRIGEEAARVREEVVAAYRQDVVSLRRAIARRDAAQTMAAAVRVRAYLADCPEKERSRLDRLIDSLNAKESLNE